MPVSIDSLAPGDRVVLNCPAARVDKKRPAEFEGVFAHAEDCGRRPGRGLTIVDDTTREYVRKAEKRGERFARFLMETRGEVEICAVFVVEPDGALRDDEDRRIWIERRLGRVMQG